MPAPIQLPAETAKRYRFTKPIFGGPVFAFPAYGIQSIDLSQLTEQQAARLLRAGWDGIEAVPVEPAPSASARSTTAPATPTEPAPKT